MVDGAIFPVLFLVKERARDLSICLPILRVVGCEVHMAIRYTVETVVVVGQLYILGAFASTSLALRCEKKLESCLNIKV